MNRIFLFLTAMLLATTLPGLASSAKIAEPKQPQSILDTVGDSTVAFDHPDDSIALVTTTKPMPRDPHDWPVGVPTYLWDFGPLDGVDNGDGTATIGTDVEGSYDVTVSCSQDFIGADNIIYTEWTLPSDSQK